MILYIHGFLSSPKSLKALQTQDYMAQHFPKTPVFVPQLPADPHRAIQILQDIFDKNQSVIKGIMGSSLGGYYASYFVEKYSVKSVLVNPAVSPYLLFDEYMGPQINPYSNEQFDVDQHYLAALKTYDTPSIKHHDCYWLLQQQGDEVLDYRQAVKKYAQCRQIVESGGDHAFTGFARFLPDIADFFGLA